MSENEKGLASDICSSAKGGIPFSSSASGKTPPNTGKHMMYGNQQQQQQQQQQQKFAKKQKHDETPDDSGISQRTMQIPNTAGQNKLVKMCEEMKMSPPRTLEGNLAEWEDIVERIQKDGFYEYFLFGCQNCEVNRKILVFLYGREYFKEDQALRKADITKMLATDNCLTEGNGTPRKRILTIIEHETDAMIEPKEYNTESWQKLIKDYGVHTIFKIFDIEMVQRIQLSGNCFLHAPAVLQGYLVQIGSKEWKGMMNLARHVRNGFTSEKLSTYIIKDGGGCSVDVLQSILEDEAKKLIMCCSSSLQTELSSVKPELLDDLTTYGPALVARFPVDDEFMNMNSSLEGTANVIPYLSHTIVPNDEMGRHAMVLIGMRRVDGKWRLLLQNWWSRMQLIEVSSDTIVSSGAEIVFARKKQTLIKDTIPTLMGKQAETFVGGRDNPEKVCPERATVPLSRKFSL
jgi:hypothetical protein